MRRFFIGKKKSADLPTNCRENRPIGKIGRFFSNFTEKKKKKNGQNTKKKTADQIAH
ncbi:unnamed protein product [Staurois parvus]|uniref:Ribosomal protein L32 n=1 Tax=Staurois parvus TaxID=386267 RepID=A0ABN9AHG6_9NEOB|nr:unnamed protein product [Staurois parvus]